MSTPAPKPSHSPDQAYHWTTRKALVFLGALAEFGRVSEAARAVGMSRQSAYRLRARLAGQGPFVRAWDRALAEGRERRRPGQATQLSAEDDIFGLGR